MINYISAVGSCLMKRDATFYKIVPNSELGTALSDDPK